MIKFINKTYIHFISICINLSDKFKFVELIKKIYKKNKTILKKIKIWNLDLRFKLMATVLYH